jgi:YD repeat-containing protein
MESFDIRVENQTLINGKNTDTESFLPKPKQGGMAYHYDYTPSGRLQSKQASGKTLLEYTYHPGGQLQSLKDVTGKTSYYSYDKAQRLLEITDEKRQ